MSLFHTERASKAQLGDVGSTFKMAYSITGKLAAQSALWPSVFSSSPHEPLHRPLRLPHNMVVGFQDVTSQEMSGFFMVEIHFIYTYMYMYIYIKRESLPIVISISIS